jgi:hypothetical protein
VPAGTTDAVGPYIRPGAYFLALRLAAGRDTKDITPVVLEYPSSNPMIPLILTSVGAQPNMGVLVYLLGNARGVPRNYHHVVLNDSLLGWMDGAQNYQALVTRAVSEAPDKHAFVTEYAGPSVPMRDVLAPEGRFGSEAEFAQRTTPQDFLALLWSSGFSTEGRLPSPVLKALATQLPKPAALVGVTEQDFYANADRYLGTWRQQNPQAFENYPAFDAPSLARDLFSTYVEPMREADALFDEFPRLTRLFTTLSPADMTADPVFGFNPDLPDVTSNHAATFTVKCSQNELSTEQGWVVPMDSPGPPPDFDQTPGALRIETLGEEGPPTVVTDNSAVIATRFPATVEPAPEPPKQGCATVDPLTVVLVAVIASLRRRRRDFPSP